MRAIGRTQLVSALVVALAVGAVGYVALQLRVGDLEERLVAEANSVVGGPRVRPVHVDSPLPGTLGQALARHLPPIEQEWEALSEDKASQAPLREVLDGERPLDELPPRYLEALARLQSDLDGVLRASRAERAELAPTEEAFAPAPQATWAGYQLAISLAGIRIRQAIAAGQPTAAMDDCLDGSGLVRDAAIAGGLIGRMASASASERLAPPCAAALTSLPEAARPEASSRLRRIRDAIPGFEATMREEAVQMQLFIYGPRLGEDFRRRLVERPRAMAMGFGGSMDETSWGERVLARALWRDLVAGYDALVAAAALHGEKRSLAFEALAEATDRRIGFVANRLPPPRNLLGYGERADLGRLWMDLVVAAGAASSHRAATGIWPTSIRVLVDEKRLSAEEGRRLEGLRLESDESGQASIVMPFPRAGQAPTQARVRL